MYNLLLHTQGTTINLCSTVYRLRALPPRRDGVEAGVR